VGRNPYNSFMSETSSSEANLWSMLCHLSSLLGFVIPFGNLVGPIVVWAIKRQEIPAVDAHGKESLNFQITVTIAAIIAGILCFVIIGFILLPIILLAWVILTIIASVKANAGESYKYPFTLRLVK